MNGFSARSLLVFLISAAFMLMTACSNLSREQTGTLAGGAAGAALGSMAGQGTGRILTTVGGAVAGGYLGSKIGKAMEPKDEAKTAQALNSNQQTSWQNSNTNTSYTVTPTKSFQSAQGDTCRQFVMQANAKGQNSQTQETACQQPDGTWKIQG